MTDMRVHQVLNDMFEYRDAILVWKLVFVSSGMRQRRYMKSA